MDYLQSLKKYAVYPMGSEIRHPEYGVGVVKSLVSPNKREVIFKHKEVIHVYDLSPERIEELAMELGVNDPSTLVSMTKPVLVIKTIDIDQVKEGGWIYD
jgi:hypothetical protein